MLLLEIACISFILIMTTFSWSYFDEDMYWRRYPSTEEKIPGIGGCKRNIALSLEVFVIF